MPTLHVLLAFVPISLVIAIVPGPSWLLVLNATAEGGRRGGFAAIAGNSLGILTHTIAAAAGLSALLYLSPTILTVLRFAGSAYLIYLGIRALRGSSLVRRDPDRAPRRDTPRIFRDGVVVNLLNPKMVLLMLSLLPQFISLERGPAATQILVLGVLHTCSSLLVLIPLCLSTDWMLGLFSKNKAVDWVFRISTATVLAAFGVQLSLTRF